MRLSLRALLAATALVPMSAVAELAAITSEPWPEPIGCHLKGVAVHTFYGRTSDLQRYWNDLSARAVASRLQILLVESMNGEAEVHVFEQSSGRTIRSLPGGLSLWPISAQTGMRRSSRAVGVPVQART